MRSEESMKMIYRRLFITLILLIGAKEILISQDYTELWVKLSPEVRMNFEKNPIEIRLRPVDIIFLPNKYMPGKPDKKQFSRIDLMLGAKVWRFKIFNYSKFDEFGYMWTGVRFDINLDFFKKKLLLNIQERYFWGLNEKSTEHYYLIQYLRYRFWKKVHIGILNYGKWKPTKAFNLGYMFLGPSVNIMLPYKFNFHIALTKDVFQKRRYMLYVRLGFKFLKKKKEKKPKEPWKWVDSNILNEGFCNFINY